MENSFNYKNLHHYLDTIFKEITPTPDRIALEKKNYWRLYHKHKKRNYREQKQEITIAFTIEEIKAIQRCNLSKQSLTGLLKSFVLERVNNANKNLDATSINQLNQELFFLIQLLEEIIENKLPINQNVVNSLQTHLITLEGLLLKL